MDSKYACGCSEKKRNCVDITVNTESLKVGNYKGLGVQWDPFTEYPLDETQWKVIAARVDYLKPTIIRCMLYAKLYCNEIDSFGNPIYDFKYSNKELMALERILMYCMDNGIDVIFGEWEAPCTYISEGSIKEAKPGSRLWSKMIGGLLNYLVNIKGYSCIKFYDYINEVGSEWSQCMDFSEWKLGIEYLSEEIKKYGLGDMVKITGPGSVWNNDWVKNSVDQVRDNLSLYDLHLYATSEEVENGEVEKSVLTIEANGLSVQLREYINENDPDGAGKDFIMSEAGMVTGKTNGDQQPNVREFWYGVSMADLVAQTMRAGLAGIIIWDLDDCMHGNKPHDKIPPDSLSLKVWGFWNSYGTKMGNPADENIRPHFYTWSLMTHLFPKGCQIIESVNASKHSLRTVAMKKRNGSGYDMSFMIVNNSDESIEIALRVPNISDESVTLSQYNYFENDRVVDVNGYPVKKAVLKDINLKDGITAELPTKGIVFFTTLCGGTPIYINNLA